MSSVFDFVVSSKKSDIGVGACLESYGFCCCLLVSDNNRGVSLMISLVQPRGRPW